MENYQIVSPKRGRGGGRLQEVVVYERFQLQGSDWVNFGVLNT